MRARSSLRHDCSPARAGKHSPVFVCAGPGTACRETWEALLGADQPIRVSELRARRVGDLGTESIRRHLRILERCGLAGRRGHKWWRVLPDDARLAGLCQSRGVLNRGAARREYHAAERREFQKIFGSPDGMAS